MSNETNTRIKELIETYFDSEIINTENYVRSDKIKSKIAEFTNDTFDWNQKKDLFEDLKINFPDYRLDNQTYFYRNDRCLRVYALIKNDEFYYDHVIRVSIFNFFSVYIQKYSVVNGRNILNPNIFFNPNENPFADQVFIIMQKYYPDISWINKEILNTPVVNLKVFDNKIRKDILIQDVLFAEI